MNFTENLIELLMGKKEPPTSRSICICPSVSVGSARRVIIHYRNINQPASKHWRVRHADRCLCLLSSFKKKNKKNLFSTLFIAWAKCSAVVLTSVSIHWAPQISGSVLARGMAPIHLFGGLSSCLTQVMLSTWRARAGVWTHKKTHALTRVAVRIRPYKKRKLIILVLLLPFWEEARFILPLALWPTWLLCKRAALYKWVPLLLKLFHFLQNI